MTVSPARLSRLVSHALRHEPWLYELELDEEGWGPAEALLAAIWRGNDQVWLADQIEPEYEAVRKPCRTS